MDAVDAANATRWFFSVQIFVSAVDSARLTENSLLSGHKDILLTSQLDDQNAKIQGFGDTYVLLQTMA